MADTRFMAVDAMQQRLNEVLKRRPVWAIAVSGGVDSMTLATLAHRYLQQPPLMMHAVSPAVPAAAHRRIERHAALENWQLRVIYADELADPDYRANPADRCYFCKSNLYRTMLAALGRHTRAAIASGANLDDLADYRPGLEAAREAGVVHPLIDAGIDKAGVRALARAHGLTDFAELPAQPCLASRIETGIPVAADSLRFIDRLETRLREITGPQATLRVRIRRGGVVVETEPDIREDHGAALMRLAAESSRRAGFCFVGLEPYRRGSAFLVARS